MCMRLWKPTRLSHWDNAAPKTMCTTRAPNANCEPDTNSTAHTHDGMCASTLYCSTALGALIQNITHLFIRDALHIYICVCICIWAKRNDEDHVDYARTLRVQPWAHAHIPYSTNTQCYDKLEIPSLMELNNKKLWWMRVWITDSMTCQIVRCCCW